MSPFDFDQNCELLENYREAIDDNAKKLKTKAAGYDPYDLAINVQKNKRLHAMVVNETRSNFFCIHGGKPE